MLYKFYLGVLENKIFINIWGDYEWKWLMGLCVLECEDPYFEEFNVCFINFVFKFLSIIIIFGH